MTAWLYGHHVSTASIGGLMSLASLVAAAGQASTPVTPYWIIILVSLTGFVAAFASLIAALANLMQSRRRDKQEREPHRHDEDRGRPW